MTMKTANEHVKGLRFKPWIMDIPLKGPTLFLYCKEWAEIPINTAFVAVHSFCCCINRSVLIVSLMPDFVLKNETNSIEYHYLCKSWARWEQRITYVMTVIPNQVYFLNPNQREVRGISFVLYF